jgi:hypothetical protein
MKPRYTATSRLQDGGGLQAGSLQARVAALRSAGWWRLQARKPRYTATVVMESCRLGRRATLSPAQCRSPQRQGG